MPAKATTTRTTKPAATTRATSTRATSTTRSNGKPPAARRKPADAPFRAVTLVTETYLDIEGLKEDFDLASCPRCAALLPSGDKAQAAHKGFHEQIDGLDQRA